MVVAPFSPSTAKLGAELSRRGVVEVAPARSPDGRSCLPAPVLAGEEDLERLGEARLARSVAADDQRQPRPGRQLERLLRADPAEAFDGDGAEVGARRFLRWLGFGGRLPAPALRLAAEDCVEAVLALACREDEQCPWGVVGVGRGKAFFDESLELWVHGGSVGSALFVKQGPRCPRSVPHKLSQPPPTLRMWAHTESSLRRTRRR